MRRLTLSVVMMGACYLASGQKFISSADISVVSSDGFYRINLTPELSAWINTDQSNIRIVSDDGTEVPFIATEDKASVPSTVFQSYRIDEKRILKDSCTIIVMENDKGHEIHNITLAIKNAQVVKQAVLSGSDDKKTWYALKEKFSMGYIDNPNGTSEIKIIDFPLSNYRYYRLVIDDRSGDPLNILRAGYYVDVPGHSEFTPIATTSLQQVNDSKSKTSTVKVTLKQPGFLERITWKVKATPYYLRQGNIYTERRSVNKKGEAKMEREFLSAVTLHARQESVQYFATVKTDNLVLVIENDDNPPLTISSLDVFQRDRFLTSWLEAGKAYTLKFGDDNMRAPVYDLAFFKDSFPDRIPVVKVSKIVSIDALQKQENVTFFTSPLFIWGAIGLVVFLLSFMSFKMIRETQRARS